LHVSFILVATSSIFAKSLLTNFFAPFSAARESNYSSRFLYHWCSELVHSTWAPMFLAQKHGFLELRRSWEPGISLTTGEFSLFRLLPKVSAVNIRWNEHDSYLSFSQNPWTHTFLRALGLAKLPVQPGYGITKGISKLVNRLIVACLMTASSRFAQSNSVGLPCYKILRSGIFNVPLPCGMRLKVSHKGRHIFE
jgi:hypothetical protein